jgi:MinD superfamily P-loop ATPase
MASLHDCDRLVEALAELRERSVAILARAQSVRRRSAEIRAAAAETVLCVEAAGARAVDVIATTRSTSETDSTVRRCASSSPAAKSPTPAV